MASSETSKFDLYTTYRKNLENHEVCMHIPFVDAANS